MHLPLYQSHKVVRAAMIAAIVRLPGRGAELSLRCAPDFTPGTPVPNPTTPTFQYVSVTEEYVTKHNPQLGGYYVLYPDGYESFSPAEAFEEGYTPIVDTVEEPVPVPRPNFSLGSHILDELFTYHRPTPEQLVRYANLRSAARQFAEVIDEHVPHGPDKLRAINQLRTAVMTANAGIACDQAMLAASMNMALSKGQ